MKIFLSYSSSWRDSNDQKEQINKFINLLLSLGFPMVNLEYRSRGKAFPGVELETDGTILFVKESWSSLQRQELCYGDAVLVSASIKHDFYDEWRGISVNEDDFSSLPSSIVLSSEQVKEEQDFVEEFIEQELNNVTVDSVLDDGRTSYSQETVGEHFKPLIESSWQSKGYAGNELKSKVDRTLCKATSQYIQRKHDDHMSLLKNQLLTLMGQVCGINGHSKEDGDKYSLLLGIKDKIARTSFTVISNNPYRNNEDDQSLTCAAKNFILLALQRNKLGYSDRTKSGEKIKEILNNPGYKQLRQLLFGKSYENSSIHYVNLLKFSGYSPESSKVKFFSSLNKQRTYDLYSSKKNEDKFLGQQEIRRFTS